MTSSEGAPSPVSSEASQGTEPDDIRIVSMGRRIVLLFVAIHMFLAVLLLSPGYIRPDSVATYAYLRSAVFNHDFVFFDEWAGFGMIHDGVTLFKEVSSTGALANHWWIGTSEIVAVPYLVVTAIASLARWPGGGFFGPWAALLGWASVAMGALASIIAYRVGRTVVGASRNVAFFAVWALWLGTPVFWYELRFPLGTHMAGAMCIAWLCWLLVRDSRSSPSLTLDFLIGLAFGLAVASRIQHFVIGPALVYYGWTARKSMKSWVVAGIGASLPMLVQAAAWMAVYPTPLGPLVSGAALGGATWMPFKKVTLLPVLFSSYHGLFTWAPVTLLAIVGLVRGCFGPRRRWGIIFLAMIVGEWLANGLFDRYFWGGFSFGPRRFVDLAVPLAIGLVWFLSSGRVIAKAAVASLATIWTLLLALAAIASRIDLARYVGPGRLVDAALHAPFDVGRAIANLHSPIVDASLARWSMVAIVILAATAAGIGWLSRSDRGSAWAYGSLVSAMLVLSLAMIGPTRSRSAGEAARFHVDVARSSRLGPLLDERKLLRDEVAWLEANGKESAARETRGEIARVEAVIDELERPAGATRRP